MDTATRTQKIGLITSRGGHLFQLYQLKEWWSQYPRFWVSFPGQDVASMLTEEKVYLANYPESRNVYNALRNFFLALRLIHKERPTVLISCGAGIAPPFFYAAKLFGIRLVFIEPYDFIYYPSISGRLVAPIVDVMLVQHIRQKSFYKKAQYKGSLL